LSSFKEIIRHHPSLVPTETAEAAPTIETLYDSLERLPTLKEAEELLMQAALKRANGNQTLAAMLLGITRQTLYNRLQK
jgi:DNA-binding protein Fis